MKNKFPQKNYKNVSNYFEDYSNSLKSTMDVISRNDLEKISKIIEKTIRSNSNIFICGNGGSSSVSNHFLCDFQKGLLIDRKLKLKTYSLTSNTDLITAISNDISYEKIFSLQLDSLARKNDLLVLFSVSGSSKNIIEACKIAKRNKLKKKIKILQSKLSGYKFYDDVISEYSALAYPRIVE